MVNGTGQCTTPTYQPPCYSTPAVCVDDCGCAYVNPAEIRSFMVECKRGDQTLVLQTAERASRLFDDAVGAPQGYFSLAPANPFIKTLLSPGGSYLPLPLHVPGSVVSAHSRYGVYARSRWAETDDGSHLILDPATENFRSFDLVPDSCSCSPCGFGGWAALVSVVARWGFNCIPGDIQEAVLEYMAQAFRRREPVAAVSMAVGNDPFLVEQAPLSWKIAVAKWKVHFRRQRTHFA